jgi:hypothetical protein
MGVLLTKVGAHLTGIRLVVAATSDSGLLAWGGAPYAILALGALMRRPSAIVIVLFGEMGIVVLDMAIYAAQQGDRGWYVVLAPVAFIPMAIFVLIVAMALNVARKPTSKRKTDGAV